MPYAQQLSDVLSEFARTMVTDFPIQGILDHLVERIVEILPVSSAGVTLISAHAEPRYIAASDGAALRFEELQTELGEGPCLAAFMTGEAVAVPDLYDDHRFPAFGPSALEAGLRAVFTFPLRQHDQRLGALDLYRQSPGPLDAAAMSVAQTLADVAAAYLTNAQSRADLRDSTAWYRERALHDPLTGLANRVLFTQRLEHAVLRARRSDKLVGLLFADLDRFKQINDRHGHRIGDELLQGVAHRLTQTLRPGDTLARLSGDEFVILCEELGDRAQAEALAERIRASVAEPFVLSGIPLRVSASVGVAFAGAGADMPDLLLREADLAMYQAKRRGGDQHQIVWNGDHVPSEPRPSLEHDLREASGGAGLRLDYQPIVATRDGRVIGVEALLRWDHPSRGALFPATVVPLAERTGHMGEIGRWVLERACRDRQAWARPGIGDVLAISVNVSAHQLRAPAFVDTVASVLAETGTRPHDLMLEVTERDFVEDPERIRIVLEELRHTGVLLVLDNFGSGASSLGTLQRFPLDAVKLDRTVVNALDTNPSSPVIVAAIVEMGRILGLSVVAEGVETTEQRQALEGLGCGSCQGHYFASPMGAAGIDELLRRPGAGVGLHLPVPVG